MDAVGSNKTFAEFFAGIGLVREGLQRSNWKCLYANDLDAKKQQIYHRRFGDAGHFHLGDVWDTDEVVSRIPEPPFLATASFPCTDLSLAGHWRGLDGEHSSAYFGFVRAIDALGPNRPRAVLLENVAGLLTSRRGADFAAVARSLAELGYWIDAFILDAKYFVPQSRRRVFFVGVDEALRETLPAADRQRGLFSELSGMETASPLRPAGMVGLMNSVALPTGWLGLDLHLPKETRCTLEDVVDLDDDQLWWDEAAVSKHHNMMSDRHKVQVAEMLSGGGLHVGTIYRRKRSGTTRAEVRFDGLAGCLRTPRGGSARQIVIAIDAGGLRMRWMSPREYARLQGAGDYPILENVNQMLYGFGDAVCVPAIEWIDREVLSPLFHFSQDAVPARGATIA